MAEQKGEIVIYHTEDGATALDVTLENQTVWLTQAQMAKLFGKDVRTISEHVSNIYVERELEKDPTIRKFRIVRKEGKRAVERAIDHYNLDVIISVGYRIKSKRGTQFRIWATNVLQDHLDKGFTLRFPTVYSAGTSAILTLPRQRSNTLALRPGYY